MKRKFLFTYLRRALRNASRRVGDDSAGNIERAAENEEHEAADKEATSATTARSSAVVARGAL